MSEEDGVLVRRRGRAEIERLVGLYRTSGMGRKDFCRSHGLGLSTRNRHLKQQQKKQKVPEEILPGLHDRSIQRIAQLTPTAWSTE